MNTQTTIKLFGACIVLTGLTQALGQPQLPRATPPARYVEGELLVKFKGGPHGDAATRAKSAMKHEVKRYFDFIGWQHIRLPAGMTVEEGLVRYNNLPDVLALEPNGITWRASGIPDDPLFSRQWGLEKIAASTAWDISTGSTNVVVAVIDEGVNYNHEDLRDNMWRNPGEIPGNGIDDDGNGYVDDVYGIDTASHDSDPLDEGAINVGYHGTAVAGVLGAVGNNGTGIAGLNWRIQIMAIRAGGTNNTYSYADLIEGFQYVTLMKRRGINIRVTNNSYGGGGGPQAFEDAIDAAGREGILSVAAAGNNYQNGGMNIDLTPHYPASYDSSNLLVAAASDVSDNLAWFSNYGRTSVDVAAPGTARTTHGPGPNDYITDDGTSIAAPHVAGAAALIAAVYPSLSVAQIKAAIMASVDVLPAFTNKTVTGGRLNVGRALYFAAGATSAPPVVVLQPQSQTVEEGIPVEFTVIASGTPPFRYRWQVSGTNVPGATNSILLFPEAQTNQAGRYTVIVSNAFGVVTSALATLTVTIDSNPVFARVTNNPLVTIPGDALAAVWGDYDNDGDVDLFVARGLGTLADLLFRNNGNGTFTNLASHLLAQDNGNSWSAAWGDYDNDGDLDLLVANTDGQNEFLYRNEGGGNFIRTTAAQTGPMVSAGGNSFDCAWVDYDNDGWLDAIISNGGYLGNENEFLYHNNGDGTFTRITNSIIANDGGQSYGIAWADYDNDGRADLFLANAFGQTNRLYHNEGNGVFTRITTGELVTEPGFSTGGDWGDYDNDGDLDLYVARSSAVNLLFRNDGNGSFTRITTSAIVNDVADSSSAIWGDYDNDGFLDLFVVTQNSQNDFLYHNEGDGTFRKITSSIAAKGGRTSLGCSWVDYDNDGHLDLFVPCAAEGLASLLYHNNGNTNGWLKVKCVGTASNRSAIGAKVRVRANLGGTNRWKLRQISGGGGFGSQLQLLAHFGLGNATNVDVLRIEWPSGAVQELRNVAVNQFLIVTEAPRLQAAGRLPNGAFQLRLTGGIGLRYDIETSSNLNVWTPWLALTNTSRTMTFLDSDATNAQRRFYRAVSP